MISFRYRSNQKKIKIKTNKKLDQRMSSWLQKVFNIKSPIIGFKSSDNKYYDVETFFLLIQKFYNTQVQIVEGNDQVQISFTSDNLNSSSFIRPSQPNTSQLNHKVASSQDDVFFVSDIKIFEKRLTDNREVSVLFDIHSGYKKEIVQNIGDLINPYTGTKLIVYILINNSNPKKSNFSIYIGRKCVVVIPLTQQYKQIILNAIVKSKSASTNLQPNKALKPQMEDEAPSFTTHHLQERLNQDACYDYLERMNRQKILTNYQYNKLIEKLDDNFIQFYKIFCENIVDNDYQSFKNQIRLKVQNNLEMLLSNVQEMDLSRPISREEQRRQNLKKPTPQIQIVKVQNYFQVLDLIKDYLDPKYLGEIKQNLLDQNEELCNYFSKFNSRQYGKQQLSKKLTNFAKVRFQDLRPFSRCVPRSTTRAKSTQAIRKDGLQDELDIEINERGRQDEERNNNDRAQEAPMFGSVTIQPEYIVSPIKNMSDIESIYKLAWDRLSKKSQQFSPEQYGLLYHYLQTKNDGILNIIQSLQDYEETSLLKLKDFLKQKIASIFSENFTQSELSYLQTVRNNQNVSYIFQNFKYECDINAFLVALKEELSKGKPQIQRILHKKSSDSQLLEKTGRAKNQRKYSDQNEQQGGQSPSPKASDMSLYQKGSQFSIYNLKLLSHPWGEQFEQMLQYCSFRQSHKIEYLRSAYADYNPSLFLWVREYLKNKETNEHSAQYFKQSIQKKQYDQKGVMKILPLYSQLLRQLENQGKITFKMRKWAVFSFMQLSIPLLASFQLYLLQKDENELVDSIKMIFQKENKDMQLYKLYLTRIQEFLMEMCVNDHASLQTFRCESEKIKSFIQVYFFTGNFEDLMENLDLLQVKHMEQAKIKISTLNFSGINTNPFEYDDGSELFVKINANVKSITNTEVPELKQWKVGKIDKYYTTSTRLSVGFNCDIDSLQGKLLNKQQFNKLWRQKFDISEAKKKIQSSEQEISECIYMDYTFYRAVIMYVYNIPTLLQLEQHIKEYNANILNQFLVKQFNRPASKLNIKQDYVIQYLLHQKIDVLCLQEAGFIDWKEQLIPGYQAYKNHDSVIIYNKNKVGLIRQDLMNKYGQDLDFNSDTSYLFTNKNFLLISAHLKSNNLHFEQAKAMFATLRQIKSENPLLKIMIGMDANHFLVHQNLLDDNGEQIFFIAPDVPEKPTTIKKRSFLQAQYKKSGLAVSEVKDHIVSTNPISEYQIERIDGQVSIQELLPNDVHPYDHYIVRARVDFL